jgi:hypothetical protein
MRLHIQESLPQPPTRNSHGLAIRHPIGLYRKEYGGFRLGAGVLALTQAQNVEELVGHKGIETDHVLSSSHKKGYYIGPGPTRWAGPWGHPNVLFSLSGR